MDEANVVKANWLYKQSSMLHRWKKRWLVLERNGALHLFKSQNSPRASHFFVLRACCVAIKTGSEVDASPPEDAVGGSDCLMQLIMRDNYRLILSAKTVDEAKSWLSLLRDAQGGVSHPKPSAPPPYGFAPVTPYQPPPPPVASGPVVQNQGPCPVIGSRFVAGGPQGFVAAPPAFGFGHAHSQGTTTYADPYTGTCHRGEFCGRVISVPPPGQVIKAPLRTQEMRNMDGSTTTVINPDGNTAYIDNSFPRGHHAQRRYFLECQRSGIGMPAQIFQPM